MKKLFYLSAIMLLIASCKSDEPKAFQIKATDMISIKPAVINYYSPAMKVKSTTGHLSALEIVKQTTEISLLMSNGIYGGRSFAPEQRDTISPKLLMWATDVINLDGNLQEDWITASDVVFVNYNLNTPTLRDTIAYIPNSVLRTAETAIRTSYAAKDIEACYTLFNNAYTFIPITGSEWRALKEQGLN